MTRTYDIRMLALTFSAGITVGLLLLRLAGSPDGHTIIASAASAGALSMLTLTSLFKWRTTASISLLFILTGIFCAASHVLAGLGSTASVHPVAESLRSMILDIPFRSPDTSALISALTTGDKSGLGRELTATFRDSGASHILALSGLHLGIIYVILLKLTVILGSTPTAKTARSLMIVSLTGYYTYTTGAPPSLVRAFLFILLNESARLLHRKVSPSGIYCAALTIQLAVTPEVLSSAGFQLSYLAMAGIFFIYPKMRAWYPEGGGWLTRLTGKLWNISALTISCQLMTGPLAYALFGTFPKYFLLTNLLALPVTNILMMLAVATIALSAVGICPDFLILITDGVASALIYIMKVISSM